MILKEVTVVLLLSGCLQVFASDKNDESFEVINNNDLHHKEVKNFPITEEEHKKKYHDSTKRYQKNYSKEKSMKYFKHDTHDYMKENEIDSKEYFDKYSDMKIHKGYQKKRAAEKKEHHMSNEKPRSLLYDTKVNFMNANKEVAVDSELIHEKPRSVPPETDINYISNNKEVIGEGELMHEIKSNKNKESYQENYQNGNEMYMKRFKKDFYQNLKKIDLSHPPSPNNTVLMARYIMHSVDWAALGTLSGRAATKGAPFVCVKAISDGLKNASTGIPFFYMSPRDLCTQDLQKDNRVSVLVTLSETEYCKEQDFDPQDPRCAKLTLSGKIKRIKAGSEEEKFARTAVFTRHPIMKTWPSDHNWYFTKLKIGQIILLDHFGGATFIKVKDYLNGEVGEPER